MIKAVFFDIDGTLLSHTLKDVPESTRRSIQKLKDQGILCVIATGRHLSEIKKLPVYDIEFDGFVTTNGHICLNSKKEVIYSHPMQGHDKAVLVDYFVNHKIYWRIRKLFISIVFYFRKQRYRRIEKKDKKLLKKQLNKSIVKIILVRLFLSSLLV